MWALMGFVVEVVAVAKPGIVDSFYFHADNRGEEGLTDESLDLLPLTLSIFYIESHTKNIEGELTLFIRLYAI